MKAPSISANNAALIFSAYPVRRSVSLRKRAAPLRASGRGLVDALEHPPGPGSRELRLEEALLHLVAEGRDVGRGHLHALALEETGGVLLGGDLAVVVDLLGRQLGRLDRGPLLGREPVAEAVREREEDV